MILAILLLAAAFFTFRFLGAQRLGGILRRAFWCGYILWAALVVYSLVYTPWKAIRAQDETLFTPPPLSSYKGDAPGDTATFTPPSLSSYKGDAPEDKASNASAKKANGGLHRVHLPPGYVLDQPDDAAQSQAVLTDSDIAKFDSEQAAHGTYTPADLAPASEQPTQPSPIQWEWAIGFLAGPLVLYRVVIFVCTGRLV